MTTTHKPATPTVGPVDRKGFIASVKEQKRRADAYENLVHALRKSRQYCDQLSSIANTISQEHGLGRKVRPEDFTDHARALLRELGEAE